MKNKKDLNNFLHSHRIAQTVAEQIKNGKIIDNSYMDGPYSQSREDFINHISSEEYFENNYKLLEDAYQKRNIRGFRKKLNERDIVSKKNRKLKRLFVSVSATAAVLILFMLIFSRQSPDILVAESVLETNTITTVESVPMLITEDSVIRLDSNMDIKTELFASDKIEDTSTRRLVVPKGYTYKIILSDSSEIMMNANSELSYPNIFSGDNREVSLKGEAFFNVRKDGKPFVVHVGNIAVKVYGTTFNINSYNADNLQTVLVNGSVGILIKNGGDGDIKMIKPNQMMTIDRRGNNNLREVDASIYIGWMAGDIISNGEKLIHFLDKIAKWYGVEFEYADDIKDINISANVRNNRPLNEVLKSIELISNVKIIEMKNEKYMIRK